MQVDSIVPNIVEHLGTTIIAAGALGTAAFGIVDALKVTAAVGEAGFGRLIATLGPLTGPLAISYGPGWETLLRAQYRGDERELTRLLRQGIRIGLNPQNAEPIALFLGTVSGTALRAAITATGTPDTGKPISDAERSAIGRYELAADARIDAALTLAKSTYASTARQTAMVVAISLALSVAWMLDVSLLSGLIVGVVAVPIAPVAKDIASGINAAATAIRSRR